jgi:hypothetical protein
MANNPGPFFFAWVNANEAFDAVAHRRLDEVIASFEIDQTEGDFAALDITVKNPHIGLLHAGRKVWAWLSVDLNWQRNGTFTPDLRPMMLGRLLGIPEGLISERVTLSFIARPLDLAEQKEAVAAALRVLPTYDPVFLTPEAQADPDSVLEALPELWHIDRTSLVVSTSNILAGEDGLDEFLESEVPYDSVQIHIGQVPARAIELTGRVNWTQSSSGGVNLGNFNFLTYAGKSLLDNWPKTNDTFDGGWRVTSGNIVDNYGIDNTETSSFTLQWSNTQKKHAVGDTISTSLSSSIALLTGPSIVTELTFGSKTGIGEASVNTTSVRIPLWALSANLALGYDAARDRQETISFIMRANFQSLVTVPDDNDVKRIDITGGNVGVALPGGEVPIGTVLRRSYFSTARGLRSLEYLLLRARAELLHASRAVEITFNCKFERALALSCRKNALLHDRRIPGGSAQGKIIKYSIKLDGTDGVAFGTVTIGCAIGYGGSVVAIPGDPTYVEDGYVTNGYQARENQLVPLDAGDVGYTVPIDAPNDDGIVFPLQGTAGVKSFQVHGSLSAQSAGIDGIITPPQSLVFNLSDYEKLRNRSTEVPKQIETFLKANAIWVEMHLANLNAGPFNDVYNVVVTDLEMPKGIDLEAASTP